MMKTEDIGCKLDMEIINCPCEAPWLACQRRVRAGSVVQARKCQQGAGQRGWAGFYYCCGEKRTWTFSNENT